jgi:hypothetical protein
VCFLFFSLNIRYSRLWKYLSYNLWRATIHNG